jgi:multicomponent Na+:H+ antiporter subunit E
MSRTTLGLFVSLLAFWFVLSDQYTPLFHHSLVRFPARIWGSVVYLAWLTWQVMASGLQVAWIVMNPRVPPEPRMLRFRTNLQNRLARVILANTISLVPGTMTVRLVDDEYLVHALVPGAADNLLDGSMQTKVARMFLEPDQEAVDARWEEPPEVDP